MSRTYEMPTEVAVALTTERIEFLSGLSDEQLRKELDVQLIRDLINDRRLLRGELATLGESLKNALGSVEASRVRWENLWDIIHCVVNTGTETQPQKKGR